VIWTDAKPSIQTQAHRRRTRCAGCGRHQISRISTEAAARGVTVTIVVDFIHVIEYVWKAAWSFHKEGDPAAELWVRQQAQQILAANATKVAGQIRRKPPPPALTPHSAPALTRAPPT
jgi:hypothetical protein